MLGVLTVIGAAGTAGASLSAALDAGYYTHGSDPQIYAWGWGTAVAEPEIRNGKPFCFMRAAIYIQDAGGRVHGVPEDNNGNCLFFSRVTANGFEEWLYPAPDLDLEPAPWGYACISVLPAGCDNVQPPGDLGNIEVGVIEPRDGDGIVGDVLRIIATITSDGIGIKNPPSLA